MATKTTGKRKNVKLNHGQRMIRIYLIGCISICNIDDRYEMEVIMEKDNSMKTLVLVFVLLYFLAPIDAAPGMIDDLIVAVMGMIISKRSNQ